MSSRHPSLADRYLIVDCLTVGPRQDIFDEDTYARYEAARGAEERNAIIDEMTKVQEGLDEIRFNGPIAKYCHRMSELYSCPLTGEAAPAPAPAPPYPRPTPPPPRQPHLTTPRSRR